MTGGASGVVRRGDPRRGSAARAVAASRERLRPSATGVIASRRGDAGFAHHQHIASAIVEGGKCIYKRTVLPGSPRRSPFWTSARKVVEENIYGFVPVSTASVSAHDTLVQAQSCLWKSRSDLLD